MNDQSDHFPVLGIQEFNQGTPADCDLLFHELHGERSIDSPHKHDFFIILLFKRGEGVHNIDFIDYSLSDYQIHLLFPEQVHQWKIKPETLGYQLMIGRTLFEGMSPSLRFPLAYYYKHPVISISEEKFNTLLYEFSAIRKELETTSILWDVISTRCKLIALILSRIAEGIFNDFKIYSSSPLLSKFLDLTDQFFKQERSVNFYADRLSISPNYLNIVCKKHLNASASSIIQNRTLLEAKRLLMSTDISVKEIVYELGFYDHASFSKFFKMHTGMTPSQFKEKK
ncbi:AraC family transcriptional regulator [Elizabethkingia anophelis]|uniref:AraC family transcriptional regulator n=1 Tax=Elizabethkingia TaxID=308865 RepID=UPI0007399896|nr:MULTISPECIES: helix-turn-helix transcriptional regulator [Elizabethkingia]KUF44105.1 AraC family transcriptional regulator [Elizabethkingia anophelis]MCT3644038.1 AraC family transcriptional regulator [Elizabethkingia anophelis]MCT3651959.1 AraC family transcriptional regulator [Elizabethkingia anophelis]MCT3655090.1 AraC family transcriptional regulator [Elizabethkingia anophelis]MCT3659287.1 AraC family transcriptional regulator [Elizabethkingia anophelis]